MSSGAWSEGDALSPTNLNSRGGGNFPDRTYNAGWGQFGAPAVAKETRIQAAITQAIADGVSYVFVPKSMQPFDASLITFNNSVQMLREGGFDANVIDAGAYGAAHNTDSTAAIQAACDAAANGPNATGPRVVRIPAGNFTVSKPIIIKQTMSIHGEETNWSGSANATTISCSLAGGPCFLPCGTQTIFDMTTALLTGTGSAYQSTNGLRWFNLRDLDTMDLNGLSQFDVQFRWKGTNGNIMLGSQGRFFASDSQTQAFMLQPFSGQLQAILTTSGSGAKTLSLAGPTITDGVSHDISLSYDGATFRAFVDGTIVASTAMTGTIVQGFAEDVCLGMGTDRAPEQTQTLNGGTSIIDGIHISDIARHTANYTPTGAKPTADSHTLCLMNFDDSYGVATKASNKNGTCWLVQRVNGLGGVSSFVMRGITISGASATHAIGVFLTPTCYNWAMYSMNFGGLRCGIYGPNGNMYAWEARRIYCNNQTNTGRYGIALGTFAGSGSLDTAWLQGYAVGLFTAGFGTSITNVFHQALVASTVYGIVLRNEGNSAMANVLNNCAFSAEVGVGSQYLAGLAFGGGAVSLNGLVAHGCAFENGNTNKPHLRADNIHSANFIACNFPQQSTPGSVMSFTGAVTRPVVFDNCHQPTAWVPWSDTTGSASVSPIGMLSSTSTRGTIRFDASDADQWDLTLTSDVTLSNWTNISYGQPVQGTIKMDSTGSRLFVWPTNSKGTVTLSYGSAAVNTFSGFYDGVNVILTSVRTGL